MIFSELNTVRHTEKYDVVLISQDTPLYEKTT